jgi:hypothetical protein
VAQEDNTVSGAYNALLLQRYDPVLDPDTPAAHHVGQHHVGCQSVSHNGNVVGTRDACLWVLAEVRHDLVAATWFFHGVWENINPRRFLDFRGQLAVDIVACCPGRVGHNQQTTSRVGGSQGLESTLFSLASRSQCFGRENDTRREEGNKETKEAK